MRETCDATSVIVTLKGAAEDVSLVHMYLGSLGKDSLFSRVDLTNIDGQDAQRQGGSGCRFTARLVVRPGYGQPQRSDAAEARGAAGRASAGGATMKAAGKLRGNWLITLPLVGLTIVYVVAFEMPARRTSRELRTELESSQAFVAGADDHGPDQ